MTMEDLVRAAIKVAEAWQEVGRQLKEAADSIYEAFNAAFGSPDLWPEKDGTPPKKYGMSLKKRPYNSVCNYHYIPRAPKNLPYMRRAY